jgi:hypothetical protein
VWNVSPLHVTALAQHACFNKSWGQGGLLMKGSSGLNHFNSS